MTVECGKIFPLVLLRAGSRGVRNKNIREIAGKKLYLYTVEQSIRLFGQCYISTNISEILSEHDRHGAVIHSRPERLCRDTSTANEAILEFIESYGLTNVDHVILLQATSPLRLDETLSKAKSLYSKYGKPCFGVLEVDNSCLKYLVDQGPELSVLSQQFCNANRQELPKVYKHTGSFYFFSVSDFLISKALPTQGIIGVEQSKTEALDIDTEFDFSIVERILTDGYNFF